MMITPGLCLAALLLQAGGSWKRNTIDDSSRGADGVRLADIDRDGDPDFVTGWEEGGVVRAYLNPGPEQARRAWPKEAVCTAPSVEDAVFADLDGDGIFEVISSCEGKTRKIIVSRRDGKTWRSEDLPAAKGMQQWMFCLPMQVDGKRGIDLVCAGKNKGAEIGWFESPEDPRKLEGWTWHPLRKAGWVMSLVAEDMDGDGDLDIVCSDRKGDRRGCFWLEHPGDPAGMWPEHAMGGQGRPQIMFLTLADLDGDGLQDAVAAVKPREILWMRRMSKDGRTWESRSIPQPEGSGTSKAVGVGDIDLDGKSDLVWSCEQADGDLRGVGVLLSRGDTWEWREVSGPEGVKFDLVELLDLDGDGDLDILTCEERANLGVFWYENPLR